MEQRITVTCHGSRGSVPVSGDRFHRYGGGTTCYELSTEDGSHLLVDLGNGLLNAPWIHEPLTDPVVAFLTHLHWDHVLAVPFLPFVYEGSAPFEIHAATHHDISAPDALDAITSPPYFPVRFSEAPVQTVFHDVNSEVIEVSEYKVTSIEMRHPGSVRSYRFQRNGRSVVIATDVEHQEGGFSKEFIEFAGGTDLLVMDAQYDVEEYETRKTGWGHSTWEQAAIAARSAEVGRLLLTSHDPNRSDAEVDRFVEWARTIFPATDAAAGGMILHP